MRVILLLFALTSLSFMSQPKFLYDFTSDSKKDWTVVNDGVMGGLSDGNYTITEDGHGLFKGEVSLENNGGFTSIRHRLALDDMEGKSKVVLRIKGDGKRYQFRIKKNNSDYHSYIQYFDTSGKWEEVELSLDEFYPSFRGRKLEMANFDASQIREITFLIANYKAEKFSLEIDHIELK